MITRPADSRSVRDPGADLHHLVLHHRDVTDFCEALVPLAADHTFRHTDPGNRTGCTLYVRPVRGSDFVAASDPDLSALARHHGRLADDQHLAPAGRTDPVRESSGTAHGSEAWAVFRSAGKALGIGSLVTVPLDLEGEGVALLSFYGSDEGTFSAQRRHAARSFAGSAERSLQLVLKLGSTTQRETNLRAALESRTTIDLALGMIMAQNRCSHQQAISILRRASNTQNTRLRAIAERIVSAYDPQQPVTHFTN